MGNIKYGNTTALKEYMINGGRVSRIESLLLFGVQNFTAVLTLIKRDGFIVKKTPVSMAKILRRINKGCYFSYSKQMLCYLILW